MPVQAPKIDPRTYDDVVKQTTALLQQYTGWQPQDGQPDAGAALVGIFSRMIEQVIERLNQTPEKNFLAFLDLIGTQMRPPRPARVPLTFQLATGSPADALVPVHTQVAALQAEGEDDEVVFETDRDLVVTRAQLVAVFVRQPDADRYDEYTQAAAGVIEKAFPALLFDKERPLDPRKPFEPGQLIEHGLYLGRDDFFTVANPKTVTLTVTSPNAAGLAALPLVWECWDGTVWKTVPVTSSASGNQWQVTMTAPPLPASRALKVAASWVDAAWIRARLNTALPPGATIPPTIEQISASVTVTRTNLLPVQAFANSVVLDLSKDFYPFGEQPRPNDALYLALPEESAKPGATVTVDLTLSNPLPAPLKASNDLVIAWEAWNGATWAAVSVPVAAAAVAKFTVSGSVALTLPATIVPRTVNGETGYWLRARMTAGNYGTPIATNVATTTNPAGNVTGVTVTTTGGYGPPSLASLTLNSTATQSGPVATCLTYNDFVYRDCTDAAKTAGLPSFQPFTVTTEMRPALYLGFDQPFDNRPMTLYLRVEPPRPGEIAEAVRNATPDAVAPRVVWEYASGGEWRSLGAVDDTNVFAESHVIRFVGPPDFTVRTEFGQERYWLRARWEAGTFLVPPRLRRVLTNTTLATQATTLQREVLGSSTGEANQVFRTTQAPVLQGQRLEVRELDLPAAAERVALAAVAGEDAVTMTLDEAGQPEEIWVRWHAVPDFHGSGPRDRHYVFDALTGEVRFGDGQSGLTPPAGRGSIRMAEYRTGNGAKGNRPVETITQLKTAVPGVDSVTNLEAAEGGAEQESLEWVKEHGPQMLRHRGRAVTAQDFEDLAYEASPDVARARVLMSMPDFDRLGRLPLPEFSFPLPQPVPPPQPGGEIKVEVKWQGGQTLAVAISGPGRGSPYQQQEGKTPLTVTYTVRPEHVVAGDLWRVALANRDATTVGNAQITITYRVAAATTPLLDTVVEVRPQAEYAPRSAIRQAGLLELVIVPRSLEARPTPSLALIARVKEYVLAHCSPTVALQVTEPDWIEVTITAQVAPASLETADALRASVVTALERFLHPLSGGFDSRGWPFGRRPHLSDLYGVIESVPGVRHVRSLSVVNVPSLAEIDPPRPGEVVEDDLTLTRLAKERRDRFLIFSGRHQISVVASLDVA